MSWPAVGSPGGESGMTRPIVTGSQPRAGREEARGEAQRSRARRHVASDLSREPLRVRREAEEPSRSASSSRFRRRAIRLPPAHPTRSRARRRILQRQGRGARGRKLQWSVQGQPGAARRRRRRLSARGRRGQGGRGDGFFHSSVNIAANEVAKTMGVPTIGTQTSAATSGKALRCRLPHPSDRPAARAAWLEFMQKKGFKRVSMGPRPPITASAS